MANSPLEFVYVSQWLFFSLGRRMRNFTSRIASPRSLNTVPRSSRSLAWLRLLLLVEELSVAGEVDLGEAAGSWAANAGAMAAARTMIHRWRCIMLLPDFLDDRAGSRDAITIIRSLLVELFLFFFFFVVVKQVAVLGYLHFLLILVVFIIFLLIVGNDIEMNGMRLRNFQLRFALWATQDFAFFHF